MKKQHEEEYFYFFLDAFGNLKIGITKDIMSRLGAYQQGYCEDSFKVSFRYLWKGKKRGIRAFERWVKRRYGDMIVDNGKGTTEWLHKADYRKMFVEFNRVIDDNGFHMELIAENVDRFNLSEKVLDN